jgi:hypothetical protein
VGKRTYGCLERGKQLEVLHSFILQQDVGSHYIFLHGGRPINYIAADRRGDLMNIRHRERSERVAKLMRHRVDIRL